MSAAEARRIHVVEIKPVSGCGNLRAFATISVEPFVIHDVRIVQQPGQRAWVSMPAQKSGERWFTVIECSDRALKDAISAAVLEAWARGS